VNLLAAEREPRPPTVKPAWEIEVKPRRDERDSGSRLVSLPVTYPSLGGILIGSEDGGMQTIRRPSTPPRSAADGAGTAVGSSNAVEKSEVLSYTAGRPTVSGARPGHGMRTRQEDSVTSKT
jgi:hypothetical protein